MRSRRLIPILAAVAVTLAGCERDRERPADQPTRPDPGVEREQAKGVRLQSGVEEVPPSPDLWSLPTEPTKHLQRVLADRGLYSGPANGIAGPETRSALHAFQARERLPVGDKITDETARALGLDITEVRTVRAPLPEPAMGSGGAGSAAPGSSAGEYLGVGKPITAANKANDLTRQRTADAGGFRSFPTLDQIAGAQRKLATRGLYRGPVSGELDDATKASVRAFQKAEGLPTTGILDHATVVALDL